MSILKVKDTNSSKYVYSTKEYVNLSPFEKSFVKHYVENGQNGSAAARAAGSKSNKPNQIAFQTLQKPDVQYVVSLLMEEATKMASFTVAELLDKSRAVYDEAMRMASQEDDPRALKEAREMVQLFMKMAGYTETKVTKNLNVSVKDDKSVLLEDEQEIKNRLREANELFSSD